MKPNSKSSTRNSLRSNLARFTAISLMAAFNLPAAVFYVSLESTNSTPPYSDWSTAATNIQDAVDAASGGDTVWVTNGVYATGGKVMAGDLTNRVVLDRPLTVQSVNGPMVTAIRGAGTTNGPGAVRCAWLTNGAVLKGFTLEQGATRAVVDVSRTMNSGGGAWCASTNALLANCIVRSNACYDRGAGVYQASLENCALYRNLGFGAASSCILNSCTVVSNTYGVSYVWYLTNSIVFYNFSGDFLGGSGYPTYCCCFWPGPGSFNAPPQLMPDCIHLLGTSPCVNTGTNLVSGEDIDGQTWNNPPSIGCDQWRPEPLVLGTPTSQLLNDPVGFALSVTVAGQPPYTCWWRRDGTPIDDDGHYSAAHTTRLIGDSVAVTDAGSYQVVVSNAFGMATSGVSRLVFHYVDSASPTPAPPFRTWDTAASTIQDAVDAAQPGEIVLVTNATYTTGGRAVVGTLTNRVSLDKAVLVQSINGPAFTTIKGQWDPATTNGPLAVRCAWLTNGAILSGFTLSGGATRDSTASVAADRSGGGVYGTTNSTVANCLIISNCAASSGGGNYNAFLHDCSVVANVVGATGGGATACSIRNCIVSGNVSAGTGGGVSESTVKNSSITGNTCSGSGPTASGAYHSALTQCTIAGNICAGPSSYFGAGVANSTLTNSIVYANSANNTVNPDYQSCSFSYSCARPLPTGPGNIATPPQLLADNVHLSQTSPCLAAGATNIAVGTDIDGQGWLSPPSMGCDQWAPVALIVTKPVAQASGTPPQLSLYLTLPAGQTPFSYSWFKDGAALADDGHHYSSSSTSNLLVAGFGPADAGSYQVVASNAFGISTSAVLQVAVRCVDAAGSAATSPYSDWLTAATNIQDAIDAGFEGHFVLVTNGVYASGGRVMNGDLTNRVALNKSLTVISMNGPDATTILGNLDPVTINGPLAIRCAWLATGAQLEGFTLTGGATRDSGDVYSLQCGGGVISGDALIVNCVIATNWANHSGGGSFGGEIETMPVNRQLGQRVWRGRVSESPLCLFDSWQLCAYGRRRLLRDDVQLYGDCESSERLRWWD